MQFDYSKLKGRIVEIYGSQANFAKAINKSVILVNKKLQNKSKFSAEAMQEWGNALKLDVSDYGTYFCTLKV